MAGAFLWDDKVAGGVLSAPLGNVAAGMPLSNVLDPQPRVRARFTGAAASILVDMGAAQGIDCVAMMGTTLTSAATVRLRVGDDPAMSSPAPVYDSGTIAAGTSAASSGAVVLLIASTATARYLLIEVEQSGAAVIDIGRLVAGPLWRLQYAVPTNAIAEGREILDRRDRNPFTGAEFPVPALVNPRKTRFTLPLLSKAEVIGQHRDMLAAIGGASEALWIPEATLSQTELCARSLWGAVQAPGEEAMPSRESFIGFSRSFAITERV